MTNLELEGVLKQRTPGVWRIEGQRVVTESGDLVLGPDGYWYTYGLSPDAALKLDAVLEGLVEVGEVFSSAKGKRKLRTHTARWVRTLKARR